MLQSSYSLPLVVAAYFIASLASYTTLDLASRIATVGKPVHRRWWLAGGAVSMGLGIWSMHFVGMLSFSLPIPLGYDIAITVFSLLIAILISYFALNLVTKDGLTPTRLIMSGTVMGLGIAGMHYTGMEAMKMQPGIEYDPLIFALSLVVA